MDLEALFQSGVYNIELIEQMYEKYTKEAGLVDPSWRDVFDRLKHLKSKPPSPSPISGSASGDFRIYHLIDAYRTYGHLMAKTNPIATHLVEEPRQLHLERMGFAPEELTQSFPTCGLLEKPLAPLQDIIDVLRKIYCGNIGVEYMRIQDPYLEQWLQENIEPSHFKIKLTIDQKKMILQHLNKSELFEVFLHTKYVGQKRFSLEGSETFIPILASVIDTGTDLGIRVFVLGMAHRGRLNVLSNILDKSYAQIFSEFEEGYIPLSFEGSGDVKYHKGFSSVIRSNTGHEATIVLAPNPSHLEAVNPVVEGQVLAKQILEEDLKKEAIVPVLIHGDAAISGQGIVYETLQLYKLEGYATGGTVHIIINNQIGFTTLPKDCRSTPYCSAIARTFNAPVFHVNAEDPESCVHVTNLAVAMRQKFHCDVFIDLCCYRKYGHNEADEPAFTQPLEYQLIRSKKSIREIYRDDLIQQGVLERQMAEALEEEFKASLQEALAGTKFHETRKVSTPVPKAAVSEEKTLFEPAKTAVAKEVLQTVVERSCHVPDGLIVHPKLEKLIKERVAMGLGEKPLDWGMGEILAYGTLLWEGIDVRLSGQDSCRGTFSHRHALWMDQVFEKGYYPLKHLKSHQGRFDLFNSPVSEYAVLGFEYGYSQANLKALVIWEAQFGDFSNGAQIIIDQFISTGEMKWGQKNGIVLFLPHGYEGQGPEHSSARIERFLTLCGDNNMQVVYPTVPAQLFHLLRRHMLKPIRKPLVVFTPKGLLRHPECTSPLESFSEGSFREILDDPASSEGAKRLVFCSGRIFYDIVAERKKRDVTDMAIVRIEQLYPFHCDRIKQLLAKYEQAEEFYWVQEEPKNMGAWGFIRPILRGVLSGKGEPKYVGRLRSASPAAGSYALHKKEHAAIMEKLFGG